MFSNDLIDFVRHGQHIKNRTSDCVNIGQNSELLKLSINSDCMGQSALFLVLFMCGSRGGQGVRTPPWKITKI